MPKESETSELHAQVIDLGTRAMRRADVVSDEMLDAAISAYNGEYEYGGMRACMRAAIAAALSKAKP